MKQPYIAYFNGMWALCWALCWALYWCGHLVSKTLDFTDGRTYSVYNWLMLRSSDVQDASGCAGPWSGVILANIE